MKYLRSPLSYLSLPQSRVRMLFAALWAIPAVLMVRSLPRFRDYQFGTFSNLYFGHIVLDSTVQMGRLQGVDSSKRRWFWMGRIDNSFWDLMVRRNLNFHPMACAIDYWNRRLPGGERHSFDSHITESRDLAGILWSADCQPAFTSEEDAHGYEWLESIGLGCHDRFVTLVVRDGHFGGSHPYESLHGFRNSDISTFVPSALWLAEQGIWVLRMGKRMKSPMIAEHPRVIDYAFRADRSDFLDVWLMAHSSGCISTATGLDSVAQIYRRPMLFLNAMPLSAWHSYTPCTWVPKDLREVSSGRILSAGEHLDHAYGQHSEYSAAGLELVALTPEEVLQEVQDWWMALADQFHASQADNDLQQAFIDLLKKSPASRMKHGIIHPEARISNSWLQRRFKLPHLSDELP